MIYGDMKPGQTCWMLEYRDAAGRPLWVKSVVPFRSVTADPNEAFHFSSMWEAQKFAEEHGLGPQYKPTEHAWGP